MSEDDCLIWSNERRAWWRPGKQGYTSHLDLAGRYPRQEAIAICADTVPGTMQALGMLPELPVRVADLKAICSDLPRHE